MKTRLVFHLESHWPSGAWIASGTGDGLEVVVRHGSAVAVHDQWFGEIVWDGDYANAAFDQTDIVYGSGGKVVDAGLKFVSSANTADRLHHFHQGRQWNVSNSFACLLNAVGAELPALDHTYRRRFESVIRGLDQYERQIPTSSGPVELTYYENLQVSDGRVTRVPKPVVRREIGSFQQYRDFLTVALVACAENMRSEHRPQVYSYLGTISTGFDSPTVAALARDAGLTEVCTFSQARGNVEDDGTEIANCIGMETIVFDRDRWQNQHLSEIPFLASDGKGEDVYFSALGDALEQKVLLTGYAAGAWTAKGHPNPHMRRADQSGLSLTEYRLWANFIHLPLPTMGVASASEADLKSLAAELQFWRSGQAYDKPFCRRVLTEANVPQHMYGLGKKKAASVLMFDRRTLLSDDSRADFLAFMREAYRSSTIVGLRCRARDLGILAVSQLANVLQSSAGLLGKWTKLKFLKRVGESERLSERAHYEPRADYLFPWAIHHAKQRYSSATAHRGEPTSAEGSGQTFAKNR